ADRTGRLGDGRALTVRVVASLRALPPRRPGTLLLVMADPPAHARRAQVLPLAAVGLGGGHELTSDTTRTDGLVTGTDLLPTITRWLGVRVPRRVQGQPLRLDGPIDVGALRG